MPWTPKPPQRVAGYLPYHPPRFVSQAEEAAARLPAQVKVQSLKNLLLRQGAKPVELEYAGLDDFVAGQPGPTVASADVLAHLQREGPLGQLRRVEQQVEGKPAGGVGWDDEPMAAWELQDAGARAPQYAPNVRQPFDPSTASNQTVYQRYTVPGWRGDFTGYREVLLEDPRNRTSGGFLMEPGRSGGAVDAHSADYWARYNEYPDRIAVQNIQSDVGQAASNSHPADAGMTLDEANDLIHRWEMGEVQADPRVEQAGRMIGHPDFDDPPDPNDDFSDAPITPRSPLARDDNWKNLMARHIALQSIAGGGKPITIPTGEQMVDVEGFGMATHGDSEAAARAASAYNEDLVRRLQKIFRGLDPRGAEAIATPVTAPLIVSAISKKRANFERRKYLVALTDELETYLNQDSLWVAGPGDREVHRLLTSGGSQKDLEMAVANGGLSQPFLDAAMRAIQRDRLLDEMGNPGVITGPVPPYTPPSDPGWTITPSPEAVRAALQKGLPIMSLLAPLLLAPPQEE